MSKYRNKFFEKIAYKCSFAEELTHKMSYDKRKNKWKKQRAKWGGWDERCSWELNSFMVEQIYTWLNIYLKEADKIVNLNYHQFEIDSVIASEREWITEILDLLEKYLLLCDDWNKEDYCNECAKKAFAIIGVIFPTLRW